MNNTILSTSHSYIATFPASQYLYLCTYIYLHAYCLTLSIYIIYYIIAYQICNSYILCNSHTTHTNTRSICTYREFNVDMHYHLGCFAKRPCVHHFLIRCHRAKVAMLTAKIESTMPRPQRTALNEAPSSLVFGWRSSIQAVWVAILCNDPYASGTFLGWELRYRIRKNSLMQFWGELHPYICSPNNPELVCFKGRTHNTHQEGFTILRWLKSLWLAIQLFTLLPLSLRFSCSNCLPLRWPNRALTRMSLEPCVLAKKRASMWSLYYPWISRHIQIIDTFFEEDKYVCWELRRWYVHKLFLEG